MIRLERKKEIVSELIEFLKSTSGIYFVNFSKLTVKETTDIRKEFFTIGAKMRVAKNTLIIRAINEIEHLYIPKEYIVGEIAVITTGEDVITPAKIIKKIFDKTGRLALKAAIIEGQLYEGEQLNLVASLPSRADNMSAIIGSLQAPISGIVGSINAVIRDLSSIIEEVSKKKSA